MLQRFKRFLVPALVAMAIHPAMSFSLLGPNNEPWQVPEIGYNPLPWDGLPTGPKNLGEEYRRNVPVLYYTFDANWLEFFGSNGVVAVEQAMKILNGVTNVSSYSPELLEFPLASLRENYTADALLLNDVKSYALHLMVEQLGLAEPERYVWTLHSRWNDGSAPCPDGMNYYIVRRNFSLTPTPLNQFQASSYVNGALYSYYIYEDCGVAPLPTADAVEFPVDLLDISFTTVASGVSASGSQASAIRSYTGKFFTGLTRDDVGGLRYLLRANNYNWESPGPTSVSLVTNPVPQLLQTLSLGTLADLALYSSDADLAALGIVSRASNYWVTVWATNTIPYFTNSPFDPAYSPPRLAFATNRIQVIESRFAHEFQNIHTVVFRNGQWVTIPITNINVYTNFVIDTLRTTTIGASRSPFTPAGSFTVTTNVVDKNFVTNHVAGEFFIMPTNACEVVILAPQLTFTNIFTNLIAYITNTFSVSNATTVTNISETYVEELIEYSTNHVFLALPVFCLQTNVVLAGGVEKLRFERRDFDSLLGRFFNPFTNTYTLNVITNNRVAPMRVQRPVTAPDFLFTAVDAPLSGGPGNEDFNVYSRNINFSTNGAAFYPGLAGPGTIETPTLITFNKSGEFYYNRSPNAYLRNTAETNQFLLWVWGSFDGTTNKPVVYPNGTSIQNIESMLFMSMSPSTLLDGFEGYAYFAEQFTAQGGVPPYTWTIAPGSPGLPPGLTLNPNGTITGVATQRGTYDFVVRGTDATGRYTERGYSVRILW